MCVACRGMHDKRNLIRIVKDKQNDITIDLTGKKNGRGAYICRDINCFKILYKQKSLNKAFKTNIDDNIYKAIEEEIVAGKSN